MIKPDWIISQTETAIEIDTKKVLKDFLKLNNDGVNISLGRIGSDIENAINDKDFEKALELAKHCQWEFSNLRIVPT